MRAAVRCLLTAVTGLSAAAALVAAPASAGATAAQPLAAQVITVQSSSAAASTARLKLWQESIHGGYVQVGGPIAARVGALGIGQAGEGSSRTPAGVFALTQAFGNRGNNGTALPYFVAGPLDWWNELSGSAGYNTHVHQAASPGGASENLYRTGAVYAHAVVIDYNRFPVRAGAGSGFFLHVTNGQPTAGCVAIASSSVDTVMRWLKPGLHPVISIGVGAAAMAPINNANAAAAQHNPRARFESVSGGRGSARVTGWALDPDGRSRQLMVDVYVDGRFRARLLTGVARPDVAAAEHAGPNQGFTGTVSAVPAGSHQVCVTARNIGLGANSALGCRAVQVS